MFGLSGIELVLIIVFGFLIFGPEKLPDIARTVGRAISRFRAVQAEMDKTLKDGLYDADAAEPIKNPLDVVDAVSKKIADEGPRKGASKQGASRKVAAKKGAPKAASAPAEKRPEPVSAEAKAASRPEEKRPAEATPAAGATVVVEEGE